MKTLIEVAQWMEDRCYNTDWCSLLGNPKPLLSDAYVVKIENGQYVWYYTERGRYTEVERFKTETEISAYVFADIKRNKTAMAHMIGFMSDQDELDLLTTELKRRDVSFHSDTIPYNGPEDPRYRVYVYGCDMKKVEDLQRLHNHADYFQADPKPDYFDASNN